ncbi:hypothetical protein PV326_014021 [Microctonus aethiopoides]|nr:hypothetical protein PV326_014021 [Microctonus aethiopoides]
MEDTTKIYQDTKRIMNCKPVIKIGDDGSFRSFDMFDFDKKIFEPTIDNREVFKRDELDLTDNIENNDGFEMLFSKLNAQLSKIEHGTEKNIDVNDNDPVDLSSITKFYMPDFIQKKFGPTIDNNDVFKHDEPELIDNKANNDDKKIYELTGFDSESNEKEHDTETNGNHSGTNNQSPLDPWSIVWYIGSFGGLVAFFLIVSCSEWCCRRSARPSTPYNPQRSVDVNNTTRGVTETPPPPYHLFAPPSYDSVNYIDLDDKTSGEKMNIYVISVPVQPTSSPQLAPA